MDKEKEIEEMAKVMHDYCVSHRCPPKDCSSCRAAALAKAGYGNVKEYKKALEENEKLLGRQGRVVCEQKKQAVKEFAAFMHGLVPIYCKGDNQLTFHREIDKRINELYGEDKL